MSGELAANNTDLDDIIVSQSEHRYFCTSTFSRPLFFQIWHAITKRNHFALSWRRKTQWPTMAYNLNVVFIVSNLGSSFVCIVKLSDF